MLGCPRNSNDARTNEPQTSIRAHVFERRSLADQEPIGLQFRTFAAATNSLHASSIGYTNVYRYRGGREAGEVAGLPETELSLQDW
jgi:hypothetical protein